MVRCNRAQTFTCPSRFKQTPRDWDLGPCCWENLQPVQYMSRKLFPRETRYSTVEKECLAIKCALNTLKYYLMGKDGLILRLISRHCNGWIAWETAMLVMHDSVCHCNLISLLCSIKLARTMWLQISSLASMRRAKHKEGEWGDDACSFHVCGGFLPQSQYKWLAKLSVGVNVSVLALWWIYNLSRMYPALCPESLGISPILPAACNG